MKIRFVSVVTKEMKVKITIKCCFTTMLLFKIIFKKHYKS